MFTTLGLFKGIGCPSGSACRVENCLFDHSLDKSATVDQTSISAITERHQSISPPPAKRRRTSLNVTAGYEINDVVIEDKHDAGGEAAVDAHTTLTAITPIIAEPIKSVNGEASRIVEPQLKPSLRNHIPESKVDTRSEVQSIQRTVSPPPTSHSGLKSKLKSVPSRSEPLVPRQLDKAPVPYPKRHKALQLLHQALTQANITCTKQLKNNLLRLTPQELISEAIDEEQHAAKTTANGTTYTSTTMGRVSELKRMDGTKWQAFIFETWRANPSPPISTAVIQSLAKKVPTGLDSTTKEVAVLKYLRTGLAQYSKFGYVTTKPSENEIAAAKLLETSNGGIQNCDRCASRFTVYKERQAEGNLTTGGSCRYHWGKQELGSDRTKTWTCCRADNATAGCTIAETHVYKVTSVPALAALWQFENTPANPDKANSPVTYDCEMVYTTNGLELCRLTAISWPDKRLLLDILVRPFGTILDFNTRFSGISRELYTSAQPYKTDTDTGTVSSTSVSTTSISTTESPSTLTSDPRPLQIVDSPVMARTLLFALLDPSTPLIGHAIDNDLNSCRIIHPFVVDTVLLYPHIRGLPARMRLKDLAQKFLHRAIQTGGAAGHDSREDSEATGDLVLVKVAHKWAEMRQGWEWEGDGLRMKSKKTVKR